MLGIFRKKYNLEDFNESLKATGDFLHQKHS